ncbi:MAG: alpha/beta hydrolase, partial [Actinomycetota bacterium]|nr:alpha/beta hydrolase [Actinomycetota bacterium]
MRRLTILLPLLAIALSGFAGNASAAECPDGLVCVDVTVPLDRSGTVPGTIDLPVVAEPGDEPLLLFLGGGPGQGMFDRAEAISSYLGPLAPGHRIAVFDQRGTGKVALRCPSIQFDALSDLTVPRPGSIEACGRKLGRTRGFYTTSATIDDLDAVRQALGAEQVSIWAVSYGTYVAERYARKYPERTSGLVLDSVIPQDNVDAFFTPGMKRSRVVLRQLCKLGVCKGIRNPVAELATLVRRSNQRAITGRATFEANGKRKRVRLDGPALFDLIIGLASFDPAGFATFPRAVHRALRGRTAPLL